MFSDIQEIISIAKQAGKAIMTCYEQVDEQDVKIKSNQTPLTVADLKAHEIIKTGLNALFPLLPVLSEESSEEEIAEHQSWGTYWLVDPLDGTKEFLAKNGEFTVNIALISNHQPILGVVYAPALTACYYSTLNGEAFFQDSGMPAVPIHIQKVENQVRILASRRHGKEKLDRLLNNFEQYELKSVGSSLKICQLAHGKADIYPRFGPTCEWDTAAAHAILKAAGGEIYNLDGDVLTYNSKPDIKNPEFFAVGDKSHDWLRLLSQCKT